MTRINVAIPPKDLCRQHLLAEHREIVRIPNVVKKGKYTLDKQPKEFTLGTGHVKFFYNKLLYLKNRYNQIYDECVRRGYNVTYFGDAFDGIPIKMMNDYQPTERDKLLIEARISERLKTMNV